jgi:hypothetical protein
MKKTPLLGLTSGIVAAGAAMFAYHMYIRPWHRHWGASFEEMTCPLPGDHVLPTAEIQITHAITIDAAPHDVWKWLVQIGQDRGGFFSYDWLENVFDLQIHNVDRIVPAFQSLKVGDFVRGARRGWLGGRFDDVAGWYVVELEPDRTLVLRDEIDHGSWAFELRPVGEHKTRLIIRARGSKPPTFGMKALNYFFWEPAHFIMERKMLLTLKEKAESKLPSALPEKLLDVADSAVA